jgi:hypothetical protein
MRRELRSGQAAFLTAKDGAHRFDRFRRFQGRLKDAHRAGPYLAGENSQQVTKLMRRSSVERRLRQLDRLTGEINAVLLMIALGLGVLDLTVLAALHMPLAPLAATAKASAAGNSAPKAETGSKASLAAFGF